MIDCPSIYFDLYASLKRIAAFLNACLKSHVFSCQATSLIQVGPWDYLR